jgi:uncharacterized protein with ATP-grasp and redox domains
LLNSTRCAGCLLDDFVGALERLAVPEPVRLRLTHGALAWLASHVGDLVPPSYLITELHRLIKRELDLEEPFAELRALCNEVGMRLYKDLSHSLAALPADEGFFEAARWAVAGNVLDFRTAGAGYEMDLASVKSELDEAVRTIDFDQRSELLALTKPGLSVLYVHDNVGEVALDRLLINQLRARGARVISAIRGGPITSDATWRDAEAVGLADSSDEVFIAGPDTLGISLREGTPELLRALAESDLVISKGQANYYVLTEPDAPVKGIVAFLFRTKCELAARRYGLKGRYRNIIALQPALA